MIYSKGFFYIDEMESSMGYKWGLLVLEKSMILIVIYFNLVYFVLIMGVFLEF